VARIADAAHNVRVSQSLAAARNEFVTPACGQAQWPRRLYLR